MPRARSPRRYAQAVFQIALERGDLDTWSEDLRALATGLENREFSDLLDAPQVPAAHKIRAIKESLGDTVDTLALNLASMLASRNLAYLLPGIVDDFGRLLDAHRGIERAEVTSAVPLNTDQRTRIAQLLEGVGDTDVRLSSAVEPQIIGGLVARIGDRMIDGSVKSKLEEMRREIVEQA